MDTETKPSKISHLTVTGEKRLVLDEVAINAARRSLHDGAVTPSFGPWRQDIIQLLNEFGVVVLISAIGASRFDFLRDSYFAHHHDAR